MPGARPPGLGATFKPNVCEAESPRPQVDIFWNGIRKAGIEGVTRSRKFHPTSKPPTPAWRLKSDAAPRPLHSVRGLGCPELRMATLNAMQKYKAHEAHNKSVQENFRQGHFTKPRQSPPPRARPCAPDGTDWHSWQLYTRPPVRNCETMRSPRVDKRAQTPENLKENAELMAERAQEIKSRHPAVPPLDPWKHEWYDVQPQKGMTQTVKPTGGGFAVSMGFVSAPPRSASTGCLLDNALRQTSRLDHWTRGRERWRKTMGR